MMTNAALLERDSAAMSRTTTAVAPRDSHRARFLGRNFRKKAPERVRMEARVAAAARQICVTQMQHHTIVACLDLC